ISDRARDQHLARLCRGSDACADRDGDAGHLAVGELTLARVQAGANLDAELLNISGDRLRTVDCARRAVEAGKEAVAGCIHLDASKARELAADDSVVLVEKLPPIAVAELRHP